MGNGPGSKKKHLDGFSGPGFMLKIMLGRNTKKHENETNFAISSPSLGSLAARSRSVDPGYHFPDARALERAEIEPLCTSKVQVVLS